MALNFPGPPISPFTGENGVVYQYIGTYPNGYWTGHNVDETSDQLDARYVQVAGDNMTGPGDLTFDTDKIVLGIDGTAHFSELTTHERGVKVKGGEVKVQDADVKVHGGDVKVMGDGEVRIGTQDETVNITLKPDGTADFAGLTTHAGGVSVTSVSGNTNKGIQISGQRTVSSSGAD